MRRRAAAVLVTVCLAVAACALVFRPATQRTWLKLAPGPAVPPLLDHVFVGISYHWSRKKLVFLKYVSPSPGPNRLCQPEDLEPTRACAAQI